MPLTAETKNILSADAIAKTKKGVRIVNCARGGLIDETALVAALERGHLAGAACDVFTIEPDANPRLLALPNFLGTPHIGGSAIEAQLAMGRAAIEGLERARVPDSRRCPDRARAATTTVI